MGASRIEELIEDIYEFIEDCKMQAFSSTKVVVPKDELYDYLDELRLRTPDEIKRYQKMLDNKDAILADAQQKADAMLQEAQEKMDALVSENEIMQQAYVQADQIVQQAYADADQIISSAQHDAEQIRSGAINYTADMLSGLENIMDKAYADSKNRYEGLLTSLKENMDIVRSNHSELLGDTGHAHQEEPVKEENLENQEEKQEEEREVIVDDYLADGDY